MDDIIYGALHILGAIVLLVAAYLQRRSASTLRDVKDTAPKLLEQLANYLQATPSHSSADAARLDELERSLTLLRRMHDDLDESTSRRFKRLQARNRRDDHEEDEEEAPPAPPNRQLPFPFAAPPLAAEPPAAPAGLPRLERIGR